MAADQRPFADGSPMTKRSLIAIAVVEKEDAYLVGRRPADVPLAGLWEFPGGKVEVGETSEQAAVRECLEETGLHVVAGAKLAEIEHTYAHGELTLVVFLTSVAQASREAAPRAPFQWIPRLEVIKLEFPPANRPILKLLENDPRKILAKEMI